MLRDESWSSDDQELWMRSYFDALGIAPFKTPLTVNRNGGQMDTPVVPGGQKIAWDERRRCAFTFHNGQVRPLYLRRGKDMKLKYYLTKGDGRK